MGQVPYRDGMAAAVEALEERRGRARARRAVLSGEARRRLPGALRAELDQDEEVALEGAIGDRVELERVEAALGRYEGALEAALEMEEQRVVAHRATRWSRLAKRAVGGGLVLLAVGWGWMVAGRYASERERCWASCEEVGRCWPRWTDVVLMREGICVASSADDCVGPCRRRGLCAYDGHGCAAVTSEHCRQSERCRDEGECHLLRGNDVGINQGATRSLGTLGACVIRNDEDCRQSRACREQGRCVVGETACVAR